MLCCFKILTISITLKWHICCQLSRCVWKHIKVYALWLRKFIWLKWCIADVRGCCQIFPGLREESLNNVRHGYFWLQNLWGLFSVPAAYKRFTAAIKHGILFICNYDPTQTFAGKASITVTVNQTEKQTKIHRKTQTLHKAFRGNVSKIRFNLQSPQRIPPKGMLVPCGFTTLHLLSYTMRRINNAQERLKHLPVLEKPINRMMGGCSLILMETPWWRISHFQRQTMHQYLPLCLFKTHVFLEGLSLNISSKCRKESVHTETRPRQAGCLPPRFASFPPELFQQAQCGYQASKRRWGRVQFQALEKEPRTQDLESPS